MTWLEIPTGKRQTSWLFSSVAEELNSGPLRTVLASGQNRIDPATFRLKLQGWVVQSLI